MRRVSEIMIGKDVASGDGFLQIVDKDYAALAPGSTIADSDVIFIKQTLASSKVKYSGPIVGKHVRSYRGESYEAPVKKALAIGYDASSAAGEAIEVNQGSEYMFLITIKGDIAKEQGVIKKRFHVMASDTATQATIATDIKAAIDAMPDYAQYISSVTINSNGADRGITIVALDFVDIAISLGENFGATVVTEDAALVLGNGSSTAVRALEDTAKGYLGFLGDRRSFVGDFATAPSYYTVSGATYDLYIIEHANPIDLQGGLERDSEPKVTVIAIPAGPSTFSQINFENVLNDYMASAPGQFLPLSL